jgi:phospholipase C
VPPSLAPDISPDFQLRGFRVPCVLVSPFARRGVVSHAEYDHTSILRLIEWRWGLNALSVRDAQAANIGVELDFDHPIWRRRRSWCPRCSTALPVRSDPGTLGP